MQFGSMVFESQTSQKNGLQGEVCCEDLRSPRKKSGRDGNSRRTGRARGQSPSGLSSAQHAEGMGLKLALGSVESWTLQRVKALDKLGLCSL